MSINMICSEADWLALIQDRPTIPQTAAELLDLKNRLLGTIPLDVEQPPESMVCGTVEKAMFEIGLRNPFLSDEDREQLALDPEVFSSPPITSAHFVVNYTEGSGSGQIPTAVAKDASNALEKAYQTYLGVFGKAIVPLGTRCQVTFTESVNSTTPPNGPINLSVSTFKLYETNSFIRSLTCFHEAFHLLQFQCGFTSYDYNRWFIEGTATWAELKYGSSSNKPSITSAEKLTWFWEHQPMGIATKSSSYISLPFFICLENYCFDGFSTKNVIVDIINTFASNYPSPTKDSVPNQIARCAQTYLDSSYTFEKLMVTFGARMAQNLWNWTQHKFQLYPKIYDAIHRPPQPITIPALQIPDDFQSDLVDQGNTWSSSDTLPSGTIAIQQATYTLQNADPSKTWAAQLKMQGLSNNYGVKNFFSVFQYVPMGSDPAVHDFPSSNDIFTFRNPSNVTVFIVFSGTYEYPVDYKFKASFQSS